MKKILVNYTGRNAGGPAYAYEMTKALVNNGVDVYAIISKYVCNLSDWEELPIKLYKIETYNSKVKFLINTIKFILLDRFKLQSELSKQNFDVIYVPLATYWTGIINRLLKNTPVCYTIHDPVMHSGENIFNKMMFRHYSHDISKAKLIVVLSKKFIDQVVNIYEINKKNIIYIPHGAFWEYKKYSTKHNDRLVNYENNKVNFLFFGRIEQYKGLDVLLQAYQKLECEYKHKISLTVAGSGDLTPYYVLIKDLSTVKVVNQMIPDSEISSLYEGSNVVTVLPYKDATQSGVIPTAQIFNSLIIASKVGAIPEQLDNGRLGILVSPGNVNELYMAMRDIVVSIDSSMYKKMRYDGYTYVKNLDWDILGKRLLDGMESVLVKRL